MTIVTLEALRSFSRLLPLAALLILAAPDARAQDETQPISPTAGLPVITGAYDHTVVGNINSVPVDFNYYDFTITGFTNVGAQNPYYAIFSFSNSSLESMPGVYGVEPGTLPPGWTFSDISDFGISTTGIYPDDPDFSLIFAQDPDTAPINPIGAPFQVYRDTGEVDPFTLGGIPVVVSVTPAVSVAPEPPALDLFALNGLIVGAMVWKGRRRKAAPTAYSLSQKS